MNTQNSLLDGSRTHDLGHSLGCSLTDLGFNLCVVPQSLVMRLVTYFRVVEVIKTEVLSGQVEELERIRYNQDQLTLIYRLRNYTVTTQYLQKVQNRRRVVYYAILLLLLLGELLGELNYIIIIFLEYNIVACWFDLE